MKLSLATVKSSAKFALSRSKLVLSKHAPDILIAVGTVSIVGGVVVACKATLKAQDILAEHEREMNTIDEAKALESGSYTDDDAKKDTIIAYTHTATHMAYVYAPAVGLIGLGIGCILVSHGMMKRRNLALMSAYSALNETINRYRDRVRKAVGEEEEKRIWLGADELVETRETDPNTGEVKETKTIAQTEKLCPSVYARFFEKGATREWKDSAMANKLFLTQTQAWCNILLHQNGHLFLNDVYKLLGFEDTSYGAVVGWIEGEGDDNVDFGMYDFDDPIHGEKKRDFLNGFEKAILLDFNVQGVIYDKI